MQSYSFSVENHKGWAGHPGQNRLAGELADSLKSGATQGAGTQAGLRLV